MNRDLQRLHDAFVEEIVGRLRLRGRGRYEQEEADEEMTKQRSEHSCVRYSENWKRMTAVQRGSVMMSRTPSESTSVSRSRLPWTRTQRCTCQLPPKVQVFFANGAM